LGAEPVRVSPFGSVAAGGGAGLGVEGRQTRQLVAALVFLPRASAAVVARSVRRRARHLRISVPSAAASARQNTSVLVAFNLKILKIDEISNVLTNLSPENDFKQKVRKILTIFSF